MGHVSRVGGACEQSGWDMSRVGEAFWWSQ